MIYLGNPNREEGLQRKSSVSKGLILLYKDYLKQQEINMDLNAQKIVNNLIALWDTQKPVVSNWFTVHKAGIEAGMKLVVAGVQQLVSLAATYNMAGVDKKALVLDATNQLFNYIVMPLLPLPLKPVAYILNNVFDSMLGGLIESAVSNLPKVVVPAP